ncbi:hypothetical protein IJE86_07390 [bacterium]|nr:hypothetical protein [bacterium]
MYNSLYPVNVKPYYVNRGFVKRKEDEEQSSGSKTQTQESQEQQRAEQANQNVTKFPRQQYPTGQPTAIDYSRSTVNVAQIITDFKNTTAAIGAPDDIKAEVETYLGLIEGESLKENPNGKIIHTNLKTASQVLDNYITATLKKPSDVVEKWIDALFLQKIDFKSDPTAINPDFQVQLPKKEESQTVVETVISEDFTAEKNSSASTYPTLPENADVKKAYIQGKKYSSIKDTDKALSAFENALKLANEKEDEIAKPLIFLEVAKIYDGHDLLPQALTLYNKAAVNTQDPTIKTKAYYSMAKIYDDAVQFHPAMEHYFASIAFAGQTDNLKVQTFSLMNIANMFAGKYNASEAKNYYETAQQMSEETSNDKLSAKVYKLSASKMSNLNETKTALDYYKQSSYYFNKNQNSLELAGNYAKSSELMLKLGNKNKAKSLLLKAQNIYKQNNMPEEMFNIEKTLHSI